MKLALSISLALFACSPRPTPTPAGLAGRDSTLPGLARPLALTLNPYRMHLKTVTVAIGGADHELLFDTAGGMTIITPQVADAIGCRPFGRLTAFRMSGERLDRPRCTNVGLDFGPLTLGHEEVIVVDLYEYLPSDWPEVGGVLSLSSFEHGAITVDLAKDRLILETAASLAARTHNMEPLAIRLGRQSAGAGLDVFVRIDSPRGPLWFELDSGAGEVIVARHAAPLLGIDLASGRVEHVPARGRHGESWRVPKAKLVVSGLGRLKTPVTVEEIIYDGVLGCCFIEDYVLTLDLRTARMWAKRSKDDEDLLDHQVDP